MKTFSHGPCTIIDEAGLIPSKRLVYLSALDETIALAPKNLISGQIIFEKESEETVKAAMIYHSADDNVGIIIRGHKVEDYDIKYSFLHEFGHRLWYYN